MTKSSREYQLSTTEQSWLDNRGDRLDRDVLIERICHAAARDIRLATFRSVEEGDCAENRLRRDIQLFVSGDLTQLLYAQCECNGCVQRRKANDPCVSR